MIVNLLFENQFGSTYNKIIFTDKLVTIKGIHSDLWYICADILYDVASGNVTPNIEELSNWGASVRLAIHDSPIGAHLRETTLYMV